MGCSDRVIQVAWVMEFNATKDIAPCGGGVSPSDLCNVGGPGEYGVTLSNAKVWPMYFGVKGLPHRRRSDHRLQE